MSDPLQVITRLEGIQQEAEEYRRGGAVNYADFALRNAAPALLKALRCLITSQRESRAALTGILSRVALVSPHYEQAQAAMATMERADAALKELSEVTL